MVVSVESAGGAGVSRLRTGTEGGREGQSEVDSIADLLGGAGRQLEQVLVVGEHVVQRRVGVITCLEGRVEISMKCSMLNAAWLGSS